MNIGKSYLPTAEAAKFMTYYENGKFKSEMLSFIYQSNYLVNISRALLLHMYSDNYLQ